MQHQYILIAVSLQVPCLLSLVTPLLSSALLTLKKKHNSFFFLQQTFALRFHLHKEKVYLLLKML